MFNKSITNSSQFLKMPPTARLLYYDLGMNADDDGFVEWFMVIRMTGAVEQDLKVLEANGFIKIFDDLVSWIKDWKENNHIQKDRYTPSKYLVKYPMLTECIQTVNELDTQVRLGKVRLDKEKNSTSCPKMDEADFNNFWLTYPRHDTKAKAKEKFLKLDKSLLQVILQSVESQNKLEQWQKDNGQFIPQPLTWINQKRWEDEVKEMPTLTFEEQRMKDAITCVNLPGDRDQAHYKFTIRDGRYTGGRVYSDKDLNEMLDFWKNYL